MVDKMFAATKYLSIHLDSNLYIEIKRLDEVGSDNHFTVTLSKRWKEKGNLDQVNTFYEQVYVTSKLEELLELLYTIREADTTRQICAKMLKVGKM